MSCTAMANEICCNKVFNVFCGMLNSGSKTGRLLHQREIFSGQGLQRETAFATFEQAICFGWIPGSRSGLLGMDFKMSMSFLAPTVVLKLPLSPPRDASVRI